ncbi:unnamed protein product [Symbiodinium sp. KB8]|nr:unnamed protein product [Symbiodinium sp. KB8]
MILEPVTASAKRSASLPAQPAQRPTPRSVSPCPSLQYPSVQFFKAPKPLELAPSALSLATAATDGTLGACARPSSLPDPVPLLTHSTPRIAQAPVFAPVLPSLESKFQFLKSPTRREAGHRDNSDLQELERHVLELVEGLQLPLEVKYWTRQQLEVFVMSGGVLRPKNCSMPDERLLANASMSKDEIVHSLAQAAEWIANADALLIGSGAGMGVDSGLGTFRGGKKGVWDGLEAVGLAYEEICEPRWFDETSGDPRLAWGFWNHCYRAYQETKPHSGYGALKQLVFVAASSNIFAAMPISGLLSAAALGGVGQTIWQYNRENYMFDVPLRQAREFQVQNVNLARFALFREDIRDLAALTTDKVANLLIVNTLKVGFIVALYFNFDRTDSGFQERTYQEDQLAVLLGMTLLTSFFFLMTSIWFAMHALQLAQAITTKLLVQVVRIPMPSENEIAKASTEGKDFELNFREALRLPFVRPAALNKDTLRDQMKDVGRQLPQLAEEMNREDSRLSNDTRAASPAAAAQSPTDSKGSPLLQTTRPLNMEVSMQELLHCLPSHAQGAFSEMEPHLKLLCLVASAWQPFDLYSRVTTVLGSSCLFSGLAYFSLYYNKFDVDGSSSMPTEAWCSFLFMSTLAWWNLTIEIAGSKLDLFVAALLILVGPTLWVASNKPTLHASVMQHFGYPVLVTIQASWICFLGIRAFTCGGEWPHFFTSTRYLNVVHKQRGPIEIPVDIARKVHEDEDTSTESSVNFKDSQHAMALAQPLIDVLSCIGDLPQSSSSRAAVFQARDWLREAARAAGVLRTSLMVKGFWIYLPMTGLDNEGAVPHWVDIHSIDYPENCKDATEAFMLPELLQAADLAAETLHAQAVRWTVHDMLRLASYGGEPVTGVNSFLFQFENISERMRTFVPSADYLFKVAMGLVSLFWIMVWVWSIMAATELFRKVSLSGTMQPFALDTPWRTVISFGCTLEGEHYVVTDSVVVQILSEEGRVWLQFGACDGDPILAVDFGQQGEVVATCERGIQATWLSGAKVQDQFWVSNISNLQDVSVDRSPLQDTVHLDAIAISGTRLVGLRYHRDSTWREVGILNVPPHKGLFTAVAVRMGRALLLTSMDEMYELDVPSGIWAGPMLLPNKNNADSYDWVSMCRLTHGRWRFLGHPSGQPMQMWSFSRPPVNDLPPRHDQAVPGGYQNGIRFRVPQATPTGQRCPFGFFSFTSNIDTHWISSGTSADRVLEVHGAVKWLQCSKPCCPDVWKAPADLCLAEDPHTHRVQGAVAPWKGTEALDAFAVAYCERGLCCCVMHLCIRGRPGAASPLDRLFDLASRLSPLFAVVMAFDSWAAFAAELAEYGGVDASTILTSAPTASCHGADTSPGTGETVEVPASPTPAIHRSRLGRSRLDSELASALRTFSPEDFALWGPPAADIDSAGELEVLLLVTFARRWIAFIHSFRGFAAHTASARAGRAQCRSPVDQEEVLPSCPKCKAVARPNVQMFGGDSGFSRARRGAQNTRYDAWVNSLASRPDVSSLSVVCLEVGCGLTVPTVRRELEKVVQRFPGGRLIRVNPENPGLAKELVEKGVSLPLPAAAAIEKLSQQVAQTEEIMQATYVLWGQEGGCEIRAPFGTCLGRLLRLVETQGRMTVEFKPDVVGIVKQAMGPRTEPLTLERSVPMDMYQEVKVGDGAKLEVTAIIRVMAKFSGGSSSVGGFSLNAPLAMRVDQVCKLLDEVNHAFSQPEYQKAAEGCEDRRSLLKETRNIQFEVLPKYGIEATEKGTSIMAAWISSAQNGIKDVDDKVAASMHLSRIAYASKLPLAKNKAKEALQQPTSEYRKTWPTSG